MGSEAPGSRKTAREEKGGWDGIWKAYLLGSGLIHWIIIGRPETMTAKRDMFCGEVIAITVAHRLT